MSLPRTLHRVALLAVLGGACDGEPPPPGPPPAPSTPSQEARQAYARAVELYGAEEPFEAVEPARRAVELAPEWAEARLALGKLLLSYSNVEFSTATFDRGRIDEAVVELERAAELEPRNADAAFWAGRALAKSARNPEAVRRFETALALDPAHGLAAKELGLLFAAEGDLARSREYLTRARGLLPKDYEIVFQLGLQLESEERLEEARQAYLESNALNPAHPGPPARLAQICRRLGDEAAAERWSAQFERGKEFGKRLSVALKHAKNESHDPASLLAVAELYAEIGMQDSARSWVERTLHLDPENRAALELSETLAKGVGSGKGNLKPR